MEKKFIVKTYKLHKYMPRLKQDETHRFVFLSDLHNVSFGPGNVRLLSAIEALHPDAVLLGGDMIIGKAGVPMDIGTGLIRALSAFVPVFLADGNHEQRLRLYPHVYGRMYDRFLREVQRSDAVYLVNETASLKLGRVDVSISGLSADRIYYYRKKTTHMPASAIREALGEKDPGSYQILLAHNPQYKDTYFDWGADLTLSGHYHGGIVRLGGHRGLVSPNFRLFSAYSYGHYHMEDKDMIITAGAGEHTIPLRLFNPREIVCVDVRFEAKKHGGER